jgi:hypothetical protein
MNAIKLSLWFAINLDFVWDSELYKYEGELPLSFILSLYVDDVYKLLTGEEKSNFAKFKICSFLAEPLF